MFPLVQDKKPVTQVLRYAKPGLQVFCPVLSIFPLRHWSNRKTLLFGQICDFAFTIEF